VEADRKWLVVVGLIFAAFLGVNNLVAVPAIATNAAKSQIKENMPTIVGEELTKYLAERNGADFEKAIRDHLKLVRDQREQVMEAASEVTKIRGQAEVDLQKMLGLQKGCILASQCPNGLANRGTVGLIWNKNTTRSEFSPGGQYNNDWTWIHPLLCCAQ